jgi:hypothetical protein
MLEGLCKAYLCILYTLKLIFYLKGRRSFKLESVSALTGKKELAIDTTQNP